MYNGLIQHQLQMQVKRMSGFSRFCFCKIYNCGDLGDRLSLSLKAFRDMEKRQEAHPHWTELLS